MPVCNGECAQRWPPFSAGLDAQPMGDWNVIIRKDGSRPCAYKGRPLYTRSNEAGPGQANSATYEEDAWQIAKP